MNSEGGDQPRRSSRVQSLEAVHEQRRLAEEEAALRDAEIQRLKQLERNRKTVHRVFGALSKLATEGPCDFTIVPDIILLEPPSDVADFDIPEKWKTNENYPRYRNITVNCYKAPLHRSCCPPEEVPMCSCTSEYGCDDDCQNRLLFM